MEENREEDENKSCRLVWTAGERWQNGWKNIYGSEVVGSRRKWRWSCFILDSSHLSKLALCDVREHVTGVYLTHTTGEVTCLTLTVSTQREGIRDYTFTDQKQLLFALSCYTDRHTTPPSLLLLLLDGKYGHTKIRVE